MRTRLFIKILISVWVIGIATMMILSNYKASADICSQYFMKNCSWYSFKTKECLCEGEKHYLDNDLIAHRFEVKFENRSEKQINVSFVIKLINKNETKSVFVSLPY